MIFEALARDCATSIQTTKHYLGCKQKFWRSSRTGISFQTGSPMTNLDLSDPGTSPARRERAASTATLKSKMVFLITTDLTTAHRSLVTVAES
jgi:hypothetical protein